MNRMLCCSLAFTAAIAVALAQVPETPPTSEGTGLGHMFPMEPPGFPGGFAQAPPQSAPAAPATKDDCGPIVGGGVSGPAGATWAGSLNNPGEGEPCSP